MKMNLLATKRKLFQGLSHMQRVGLYPGTFDPITRGHLDIISRAMKLVDHLIIGIAVSEAKKPLFTPTERVTTLEREINALGNPADIRLEVKLFDNLLIQFAQDCGAGILIRGLRAVSDFEYEYQMTAMNEKLAPDIETVFLMADVEHQAVASRLVKEIALFGGSVSDFVTEEVERELVEKLQR